VNNYTRGNEQRNINIQFTNHYYQQGTLIINANVGVERLK